MLKLCSKAATCQDMLLSALISCEAHECCLISCEAHECCRLTPPPEASYSLHRKLSGAFLACIKLRARVPCNKLFFDIYERYSFQEEPKAQTA